MSKKNNKPSGTLFSPEFREVAGRLKDREPELDAIIEGSGGHGEQEGDTSGKGEDLAGNDEPTGSGEDIG